MDEDGAQQMQWYQVELETRRFIEEHTDYVESKYEQETGEQNDCIKSKKTNIRA